MKVSKHGWSYKLLREKIRHFYKKNPQLCRKRFYVKKENFIFRFLLAKKFLLSNESRPSLPVILPLRLEKSQKFVNFANPSPSPPPP